MRDTKLIPSTKIIKKCLFGAQVNDVQAIILHGVHIYLIALNMDKKYLRFTIDVILALYYMVIVYCYNLIRVKSKTHFKKPVNTEL